MVLLVRRWVGLDHGQSSGLDESQWDLMFEVNPRAELVEASQVKGQIEAWLNDLDEEGLISEKGGRREIPRL